eukprot:190707_1
MQTLVLYSLVWVQFASSQSISPTSSPTESIIYSCLSSFQCEHAYLKCKENEDCQVDCGGYGCYHATIQGPINGNLSIKCTDRSSCYSTTIHGPEYGELNVYCLGTMGSYGYVDYNCESAIIYGPTNGDLNLECDENQSCRGATIHGPTNGNLNVYCCGVSSSYDSSCKNTKINA